MSRYARRCQKKKEPRWYAFLKAATDTLGFTPKLQIGIDEIVSSDHVLMLIPPKGKAQNLLRAWYDDGNNVLPTDANNHHSTFVRLTNEKYHIGKVQLNISLMKNILTMMEKTGEERIIISIFEGEARSEDHDCDSEWSRSMPAVFHGPENHLIVVLAPVISTM